MSLETFGNDKSMNLDNVLLTNIQSSLYFKNLYQKKTYHEVIDEIKRNVEILAPYIPNTKTPSTAYCLLYKFFSIRLTVKQMTGLLGNYDSPYVRAIGALYLRYCHPPANLWDWYADYLDDQETIFTSKTTEVTIQRFLLDLLKENKFAGTVLPRIPTKIQQDLDKKIKEYEIENNLTNNNTNNKYSSKDSYSRDNRDTRDNRDNRDNRDPYRDTYRDNHRDNYRDRDSHRDNHRDNHRDSYRDRDSYNRDSRDNRDSYRNNRYNDDNGKDSYAEELERYKSERNKNSGGSRNYSSSGGSSGSRRDDDYSKSRSSYDDRNRDRGYSSGGGGGNKRDNYYSDDDSDSEDDRSHVGRKRSRSRSNSRDRGSNQKTTTVTSTTTEKQPKEESESLKKLRSLYGATSDQVSLD
ncbi:hypothetical protein ACTA71_001351 [Dictyostelium dimigraforme]